jgi:hypothetical protein
MMARIMSFLGMSQKKMGSLFFTEQNPVSLSSGWYAKRSSHAFTLYLRQYHSEPQLRRTSVRAICFPGHACFFQ